MKLATLACLSALCLCTASAHAAPGDPAPKPETAAPAPNAAAANPATGPSAAARAEPAGAKAEPPRSEKAAGRPRRPTYAACNRASHQRGYHGGRRRRFLIRCRLGYERPRTNQHQAPAGPPAPVRKP